MRRMFKYLGTLLAIIMVAAVTLGIIGPQEVQAASKKTVRVSTQKELNKALKNSKVGTIILRTSTYDKITINSKKAKKKNVIIDAPSAVVENKSKLKSIEIQSVTKYIENASGNTIVDNYGGEFILADGKNVKKLTLKYFNTDYIIGKGASISSLVYDIDGKKSSFDKATGKLKLTNTVGVGEYYVDYREVDVVYTLTLDEAGRVTGISYTDPDGRLLETTVKYDKYGNFTEVKEVVAKTKETVFIRESKYDADHNLTYRYLNGKDYSETSTYEYDSKGRVVADTYDTSYDCHIKDKYTYDSNGRKVGKDCNYLYGSWGYDYVSEMSYDSNGFLLSNVETYSEGYKYIMNYEYDKSGNRTYWSREELYTDGKSAMYEYKTEYDKLGGVLNEYIKFPGEDEWYNFDDLGD